MKTMVQSPLSSHANAKHCAVDHYINQCMHGKHILKAKNEFMCV